MKRLVLLTALAAGLLAAGATVAIATPSSHKANGPVVGTVKVNYKVDKFVKKGSALVAQGAATVTYTD